jgi:cytochrome c biogenesis protein
VAHDPGQLVTLLGAVAAIIGVMGSLMIRRRRIWVRATTDDRGRTLVTFGGLARTEASGLSAEVDHVVAQVKGEEQQ